MSNFICVCGMREGTNTNNCERCLLVARINQLYEQRQNLESENKQLREGIVNVIKQFDHAPLSDVWWMPEPMACTVLEYLHNLIGMEGGESR